MTNNYCKDARHGLKLKLNSRLYMQLTNSGIDGNFALFEGILKWFITSQNFCFGVYGRQFGAKVRQNSNMQIWRDFWCPSSLISLSKHFSCQKSPLCAGIV